MRRIKSQRRVVRPPQDGQYGQYGQPQPYDNTSSPTEYGTGRKKSWVGILGIIVLIIAGGAFYFWYSTKSAEDARKAGPDAVVKEVVSALGQGSESRGKKFVETGDVAVSAKLANLFSSYQQYTYNDDYIDWQNMKYEVKSQDEAEALIEVSGMADIVEVEKQTWTDSQGQEIEDTTEISAAQYNFSGVVFGLKKVGEEWFLAEVPSKIF